MTSEPVVLYISYPDVSMLTRELLRSVARIDDTLAGDSSLSDFNRRELQTKADRILDLRTELLIVMEEYKEKHGEYVYES